MPVIPGTILFTTLPVPREGTFIAGGTLIPNDIVYVDTADGLVKVIAAGTNMTTANTSGGILGIALSNASANGGVRVALIDSNTELWLPYFTAASGGSAINQATLMANAAYVLVKCNSGTNNSNYAVDLNTTTNGLARVIEKCDDSYSYNLVTTGTAVGVFTGNPSINTPKSGVVAGDLIRLTIPESARWVKA